MSELKQIACSMANAKTKSEWDELENRCKNLIPMCAKKDPEQTLQIVQGLKILKALNGFAA